MSESNSLENTIENMIRDWPAYATHRTDVLDRLFCMVGTGYEWVGGCIVFDGKVRGRAGGPSAVEIYENALASLEEGNADGQFSEGIAALRVLIDGRKAVQARLAAISDECAQRATVKPVPACFYPVWADGSAPIATVPDDVRQDWLDGAYEVLDLVELIDGTGPFLGPLANVTDPDEVARIHALLDTHPNTLAAMRDIRKDLDRRFPGRKANF